MSLRHLEGTDKLFYYVNVKATALFNSNLQTNIGLPVIWSMMDPMHRCPDKVCLSQTAHQDKTLWNPIEVTAQSIRQ